MPKLSAGKMADRRANIMEAALRCFETRGFAASTVDDVCNEAGISKGAFYTHFASKDALIHALLEQRNATLANIAGETLDALEQAIFDEIVASVWETESGRIELEAMAASASDPELNRRVSANMARIDAQLTLGLERLRDAGKVSLLGHPTDIAEIIHCFAIGKMATRVVQPALSLEACRAALHALIRAFAVPSQP
jgi:AcrR family transcriptional regulator